MSATNNPLSSLSKEQLDALLDVLRKQTKPSHDPTPIPTPSAPALSYYLVSRGWFETVVDGRDVPSCLPEAIRDAALHSLQPWYYHKPSVMDDFNKDDKEFSYTTITREEYIAWLRR